MIWEFNPPPAKPGEPILAEHIQAILEIRDKLVTEYAPPLARNGDVVYLDALDVFWIKLTGAPSGSAHPWTEQLPDTGGTWVSGYDTGSTTDDPAYEVNGSTTDLSNLIALAWRDPTSGEVRFMYSVC